MGVSGTGDANSILRAASALASGSVPALKNIKPERILFVFNPALRGARARILPLRFDSTGLSQSRDPSKRRPVVKYGGVSILYVVEYSRSFLRSGPDEMLRTLLHELLHASPFFNGTLSKSMRHSRSDAQVFKNNVDKAMESFIKTHGDPAGVLKFEPGAFHHKWREPFSLSDPRPRTGSDLVKVVFKTGQQSLPVS